MNEDHSTSNCIDGTNNDMITNETSLDVRNDMNEDHFTSNCNDGRDNEMMTNETSPDVRNDMNEAHSNLDCKEGKDMMSNRGSILRKASGIHFSLDFLPNYEMKKYLEIIRFLQVSGLYGSLTVISVYLISVKSYDRESFDGDSCDEIGIVNQGCECYSSVIIQLLISSTPSMNELCKKAFHISIDDAKSCITSAIIKLIGEMEMVRVGMKNCSFVDSDHFKHCMNKNLISNIGMNSETMNIMIQLNFLEFYAKT